MKIDQTNVPPTDTVATLTLAIRLLQAGSISEAEFYTLTSCLRAAAWTFSGAGSDGR